jgi:cation transport ATPase
MENNEQRDDNQISSQNEIAEAKKIFNSGTTFAGIGFLILIVGRIFNLMGGNMIYFGKILLILAMIIFFIGCFRMAKGKGYHMAWGLLGFLSLIGLIILFLLPNRIEKKYKTA